jgi:hypothetical protein
MSTAAGKDVDIHDEKILLAFLLDPELDLIFCALIFAGVYGFVAALICLELNEERPHWWCPLCRVCGLMARRFRS